MLAQHLLWTGLPGAAVVAVAIRRGVRELPILLALALVASGGVAILSFWLYYADPDGGRVAAFALIAGSLAALVWGVRKGVPRETLRGLAVPAALWALGSVFVLFLGFIHTGTPVDFDIPAPVGSAGYRFSHVLPTDNEIPWHFAEYFYNHGHEGTPPPFGDWLSSDRPPLQVGYVLAQRPFGWDQTGLHYQVLGVVLQQLWIVGLWALLCAARLTPFTRGLAAVAAIVSDVGILHAFYVWPKLIAAAFLLAALALVMSEQWERLRRQPLGAIVFAALCALAMLAHGSSAFFILPLLGFAVLRGRPNVAWIGTAAAVAVVLLGSWSAYQRYADPPGDRLVKWQIGGSLKSDDRGMLETIVDSYREAGVGGTLQNKWDNVEMIAGVGELDKAADSISEQGDFDHAVAALRVPRFFSLVPFLGLLLIGPIAMAIARARGPRDGPDWRFAVTAGAFTLIACAVWVVLMFGSPESTAIIHQGSLAVPLLAVCACVAGACAVDPRLGAALVALNVALVLVLYVPMLTPIPGTFYSKSAELLLVAALAGIAALTLRPLRARVAA